MPSENPAGDLERTASAIERGRETFLAALGKTYSIVVLASLALVIAAFSRNVSGAAASFAVAAATAFFAAAVLTVVHEVRRTMRLVFHIEVGSARIVSVAAGFAMLGAVVLEFARADEITARVTVLLLGTVTLVALASLILASHEALDRVLGEDPSRSLPQRAYLRATRWIVAAGWLVLVSAVVLVVLGIGVPIWLAVTGILAVLLAIGSVRIVVRTAQRRYARQSPLRYRLASRRPIRLVAL